MRVWEIEPARLCRPHLLGEHREIHCIWTFITTERGGAYKNHPETRRWVGKLGALKRRHDALATEMGARGYNHQSPLGNEFTASDVTLQDIFLLTVPEQESLLRAKGCRCDV